MDPSVSVLITNYDTSDLTLRCVNSVARFKGNRDVQVVVVDDGSTKPIRGRLPAWVELVENVPNQGYVRSVNIGVRRTRGDIVLLLDSDADPLCDVFTPVATAFATRPALGALGFHLVNASGVPTGAAQPEPTALGLAVGQQLEARLITLLPHLFGPAFAIYSCAIAFRRKAFDDLGGFDEGFDFFDADIDFSMRLRRSGWDLDMEHDVKILHEGSGSPQSTAQRVVRFHANRWRLLEKHGHLRSPTFLKSALAVRHVAELLWLTGPGRFLYADSAVHRDKLESLRRLVATVWHSYRATEG